MDRPTDLSNTLPSNTAVTPDDQAREVHDETQHDDSRREDVRQAEFVREAQPERESRAADGMSEAAPVAAVNPALELRERNPEADSLEAAVFQVLHTIYDPEIPVDIFELGLIYGVDIDAAGKVKITMTLTSPTCPAAQSLPAEVEQKVKGVQGVSDYEFELTWEPTWNPEMMSEAAKLTLGMM